MSGSADEEDYESEPEPEPEPGPEPGPEPEQVRSGRAKFAAGREGERRGGGGGGGRAGPGEQCGAGSGPGSAPHGPGHPAAAPGVAAAPGGAGVEREPPAGPGRAGPRGSSVRAPRPAPPQGGGGPRLLVPHRGSSEPIRVFFYLTKRLKSPRDFGSAEPGYLAAAPGTASSLPSQGWGIKGRMRGEMEREVLSLRPGFYSLKGSLSLWGGKENKLFEFMK